MSQLKTRCPHCDRSLKLDVKAINKKVRCPNCKAVFVVENVSSLNDEIQTTEQEALATRSQPTPIQERPSVENSNCNQNRTAASESRASFDAPQTERHKTRHEPKDKADSRSSFQTIGRYRVVRELGRGAFGVVYAALDEVLKREVAIKLCHRNTATTERDATKIETLSDEQSQRLLSEARAAAKLRHPNIVAVFEAGMHQQQVFVASELVTGQTLADRIQAGSIDPRGAAVILRDLARGLDYAHQQNLVHRDIKPQNILIDSDSRAQIADFGLAFDRGNEEQFREQAYSHSGTLAYMAPEQAGITGVSVGPQADQYALGATLFESLTGQRPHQGGTLEILKGLELEAPRRARSVKPQVDVDLDAICFKAMSHQPWQRYESCGELADDLDRYLGGDLIKGRKIGVVERIRHFSKRRPQVAAWSAAAAATFAALLFYLAGSAVRNIYVLRQMAAENAKLQAENGRQIQWIDQSTELLAENLTGQNRLANHSVGSDLPSLEKLNELAGWIAYSRKLKKASSSFIEKNLDRGSQLIQETTPDYRDWEFRYLNAISGKPVISWKNPIGLASRNSNDAGNQVIPLDGGLVPAPYGDVGDKNSSAIPVADGIVAGEASGNQNDSAGAALIPVLAVGGVGSNGWNRPVRPQLIAMPDASQLTIQTGNELTIHDLTTGEVLAKSTIPTKETGPSDYKLFPLSDNGQFLIADGTEIRFWDAKSSRERPALKFSHPVIVHALSDDGRWLLLETSAIQQGGNSKDSKANSVLERRLELWDLQSQKQANVIPASAFVDPETGKDLQTNRIVSSALASPDSTFFLIAVAGSTFRLFIDAQSNPVTPEIIIDKLFNHSVGNGGPSEVEILRHISCDLKQAYYRTYGGKIASLSFDNTSMELDKRSEVFHWDASMADLPGGRTIFAANQGGDFFLGDSERSILLYQSSSEYAKQYPWLMPKPIFSKNGRFLITYDGDEVRIWDAMTLLSPSLPDGGTSIVSMDQSRDGSLMGIAYQNGRIDFWNPLDNSPHLTSKVPSVNAISFHPNQPLIAAGGPDQIIRLIDIQDGMIRREFPKLPATIHSLAYAPDGSQLAVGLSFPISAEIQPVELTESIAILDPQSGRVISTLPGHHPVTTGLTFSADGTRLVSSGSDGRVILWDASSFQSIAQYQCEPGGLPDSLQFSTDGRQLAVVVESGKMGFRVETQERTVSRTLMRPETRTKSETVIVENTVLVEQPVEKNLEGDLITDSLIIQRTEMIPETKEIAYQVQVPYLETVTQTFQVIVPSRITNADETNHDQINPHVVSLQSDDLSERARWYPEGKAVPQSLTFAANGNRLFVNTDLGVSVLHPDYFFELVELRNHRDTIDPQSLGKILFNGPNEVLVVGNAQAGHRSSTRLHLLSLSDKLEGIRLKQALNAGYQLDSHKLVDTEELINSDGQSTVQKQPSSIAEMFGTRIYPSADLSSSPELRFKSGGKQFTSLSEIAKEISTTSLTEITPASESENPSSDQTLRVGEQEFFSNQFLNAAAGSTYLFDIPSDWSTFHSLFGLDSSQNGAAVFVIRGDGRTLYRSPIIRDHLLHEIRLDIRGIKRLELISEYVDRGRIRGNAAWITPTLEREISKPRYRPELDEIRLVGTDLDFCEIRLSSSGFKLERLFYTEPNFKVNGHNWNPKSDPELPNGEEAKFLTEDVDFGLARVHALRLGEGGNLDYQIDKDGITLLFTRPAVGSTDFECVIQVPRRQREKADNETTIASEFEWSNLWQVTGYAIPESAENPFPKNLDQISTNALKPFRQAEMETLNWSWPEERSGLEDTPESRYAIVAQRSFKTAGGYFSIETLCDGAIRVRVNGEVRLEDWVRRQARQTNVPIKLEAGEHLIEIEYYQPNGKSRLMVSMRPLEKDLVSTSDWPPRNKPSQRELSQPARLNSPDAPSPKLLPLVPTTENQPESRPEPPALPSFALPVPASSLPDDLIHAWEDAGARPRMYGLDQLGQVTRLISATEQAGRIPGFGVDKWNWEKLANLPAPQVGYGISGLLAGTTDADLAKLPSPQKFQYLELFRRAKSRMRDFGC